nr:family 43 glycosylhydrolase [Eubacterium sp.]
MALVMSTVVCPEATDSLAATKIKLSKKKVVVKIGKKKSLSVTKNKGASYRWKVKKKKIAKIVKGAKSRKVTIRGCKKGTTTITCQVKQRGKKAVVLKAKIVVQKKNKSTQTEAPKVEATVAPTAGVSTTAPTTPASTATATPAGVSTTPPTSTVVPTSTPVAQPTVEPTLQPTEPPVEEDYSMTLDAQIATDSNGGAAVKDNGDGTSTVTFSGNYSTVLLPIGEKEVYDLSAYETMIVDVATTPEIRVSLFDAKGNNIMPPTSGTAEWSQWTYITGDDKFEIDITSIPREEVAYIALCSKTETEPLTLRGLQFFASDYRLKFDAQYAKDSEDSSKLVDNGDGTSTLNFPAKYNNINIPLGEGSYNLSQYTKMILDITCEEEFRVTISNSKGVNIQPPSSGTAEWSQWWYVGADGVDGKIECDLSAFKKEDLADACFVTICANQDTLKPVVLKGITFEGDARVEKFVIEEEDLGPQDPYTENLRLTKSYSEVNGQIYNNPLITQDYVADPTAIEYNGRLYVFGTNDVVEFDSKGVPVDNAYNTHKLRILSTEDMVNWRDEGIIDVTELTDYAEKSWAPSICSKEIDGKTKFFLYYTTGGNGIGVLEADSPTGPWRDPIGETLINHDTPNCSEEEVPWCFDPSVLIDDDGKAYLYFGGGPDSPSGKETNGEHPKSARVVELGADMVSLAGDPVMIDAPWYLEDNEINKVGDTYYYSYCTNWSVKNDPKATSCCIAYMTSKDPMTGWEYQGQLFANPGTVFSHYYNNHHKMMQYKDEWYLLYHSTLLEQAQYGTKKGYRSLHVDKLTWEDGVPSATPTYESVTPLANFNPYATVPAAEMAWNGGLSTVSATVGDATQMVLDSVNTGDWFGIKGADFGNEGAASVSMNIAGETEEGYIEVYVDAPSTEKGGTLVTKIDLKNTGSTEQYDSITAEISEAVTGVHDVYFVLRGEGYRIANWSFHNK